MGIEITDRAAYLRVIFHELSRMHSHLLWLGLLADGFGFEALFMHAWRLRETVLDIFEQVTGGRVIFSACDVGGFRQEVSNETLAGIVIKLERLREEYRSIAKTLLEDSSVKSRMVGVGHISTEKASSSRWSAPSHVPPTSPPTSASTASVPTASSPPSNPCSPMAVTATRAVMYACARYCNPSTSLLSSSTRFPTARSWCLSRARPEDGAQAMTTLEQPRGQAFYYSKGNGTKNLARMRVRTPTSQNIAGMVAALSNVELADVPMVVLTIDPCISCTER